MLEYGCYPLLLLVATPWFLNRLGVEEYGHWMLLTATVAFGGAVNTGTGSATIKVVSAGIGRAAKSEIQWAIRTALGVSIVSGACLAVLVFVVFRYAGGVLFSRMGDPSLVIMTGMAAALLIWIEQLDNVFSSAMKGAEYFGHAARVEIASKTIQIISAALVLISWPGLKALYFVLIVMALLRLFVKAIIAQSLLKLPSLRPSLVDAGSILEFAKWGWLQGIGGVFFGVADRILVGSYFGAANLAYYSIASQLAMQIHAATAAGLGVVFPMISRKLEERNQFSLEDAVKRIAIANFAFSSALAVGLLLFNKGLLELWLGVGQSAPVTQILPHLVVAYWLLALNVTPHYILLSVGRFRFVSLTNISAGLMFIISAYIFAERYGVVGLASARSIYGLVIMINIIPFIREIRRAGRK